MTKQTPEHYALFSVSGGKFHKPAGPYEGRRGAFRSTATACGLTVEPQNYFRTVEDANSHMGGNLTPYMCKRCARLEGYTPPAPAAPDFSTVWMENAEGDYIAPAYAGAKITMDGEGGYFATVNGEFVTAPEGIAEGVPFHFARIDVAGDAVIKVLKGENPFPAAADPVLPTNGTHEALTELYGRFLRKHKLAEASADELICRDDLTAPQREWLSYFIRVWEATADTPKCVACDGEGYFSSGAECADCHGTGKATPAMDTDASPYEIAARAAGWSWSNSHGHYWKPDYSGAPWGGDGDTWETLCEVFGIEVAEASPIMSQVRHDLHGYYHCSAEEAAHEDEGNPSVGFDGRQHWADLSDACNALGVLTGERIQRQIDEAAPVVEPPLVTSFLAWRADQGLPEITAEQHAFLLAWKAPNNATPIVEPVDTIPAAEAAPRFAAHGQLVADTPQTVGGWYCIRPVLIPAEGKRMPHYGDAVAFAETFEMAQALAGQAAPLPPGFTEMVNAIGELIHNRAHLDLHADDKLMLAKAWALATGDTLPTCADCGATVLEVHGCPDGAEVCDSCLDGH